MPLGVSQRGVMCENGRKQVQIIHSLFHFKLASTNLLLVTCFVWQRNEVNIESKDIWKEATVWIDKVDRDWCWFKFKESYFVFTNNKKIICRNWKISEICGNCKTRQNHKAILGKSVSVLRRHIILLKTFSKRHSQLYEVFSALSDLLNTKWHSR